MAAEERVLCFERKLLEDLRAFQGIDLEVEKYLPVLGFQEEAGKIGSLFARVTASGNFRLTQVQDREVKDRLEFVGL